MAWEERATGMNTKKYFYAVHKVLFFFWILCFVLCFFSALLNEFFLFERNYPRIFAGTGFVFYIIHIFYFGIIYASLNKRNKF